MAALILDLMWLYLLVGGLVAAAFVTWGVGRVEPNARGAFAFRPLVVPGVMLIWPLVLWRWRVLARGEDTARRHRPPMRTQAALAIALALAVPLILGLGLLARQNGPHEREAVMLAPPDPAVEP